MGKFTAVTFTGSLRRDKGTSMGGLDSRGRKIHGCRKVRKRPCSSVSDCQAIVKKAVVEKLKEKYDVDWFDETGAAYTVQVAILKDVATLAIYTSGTGLHKRGPANALTPAQGVACTASGAELLAQGSGAVRSSRVGNNSLLKRPCSRARLPRSQWHFIENASGRSVGRRQAKML